MNKYDSVHSQCIATGCQYANALAILNQAQAVLDKSQGKTTQRKGSRTMEQSVWCRVGNHSFGEFDYGRTHVQYTIYDDNGNVIESKERDMCGKHSREAGFAPKSDVKSVGEILGT